MPPISLRHGVFAPVLLSVATGFTLYASAEEEAPKLVIVDRSMTRGDLYTCTLEIPKSLSFDMVVLTLKDRKNVKVGDASLGTMDRPEGKLSAFFLNHELVKNSVVVIDFPLDEPRKTLSSSLAIKARWSKKTVRQSPFPSSEIEKTA